MNCTTARALAPFMSRGARELPPEDLAAYAEHIASCPDCAAQARSERLEDAAIGQAMREVPIPAALRGRVLAAVRKRRRLPVRVLAAAACLFLTVGLGIGWWMRPAPELSVEEIANQLVSQVANQPDKIEEWFAERGLTMIAPRQFNYQYLTSYEIVVFQGQQVPQLEFFYQGRGNSPPTVAKVMVLSGRNFNLDMEPSRIPSGSLSLRILPFENAPGYLFLVASTGGPFDVFLQSAV